MSAWYPRASFPFERGRGLRPSFPQEHRIEFWRGQASGKFTGAAFFLSGKRGRCKHSPVQFRAPLARGIQLFERVHLETHRPEN